MGMPQMPVIVAQNAAPQVDAKLLLWPVVNVGCTRPLETGSIQQV